MSTQPTLFGYPTTRTRQGELFVTSEVDIHCGRCGRLLVLTDSDYLCCPAGHGGLIPEYDPSGTWFGDDVSYDE